MANGLIGRLDAALTRDARFTAAIGQLPAAVRTGDLPLAEREVRAAAIAVAGRAIGHALRGLMTWPRVAWASRRTSPAAPGA
jgi:hypothetical protein